MSNQTVFDNVGEQELKTLYDDFLQSKEEGLRPRSFDPYIQEIKETYAMPFGVAWQYAEKAFLEEVAKRYFSKSAEQGS